MVTLTHDPKIDDPALVVALKSDAFYVGDEVAEFVAVDDAALHYPGAVSAGYLLALSPGYVFRHMSAAYVASGRDLELI